ncbi:hypothetical protein B0A48_18746, partial [Cryoendolithus antarcticus]
MCTVAEQSDRTFVARLQQGQPDPTHILPLELVFDILSYLEVASLVKASAVSQRWRALCLSPCLWKALYLREGWRVIDTPASRTPDHPLYAQRSRKVVLDVVSQDQDVTWHFLFRQKTRLKDNWNAGRFFQFQLPHPDHAAEGHTGAVYAIQQCGRQLVSGGADGSSDVVSANLGPTHNWRVRSERLEDGEVNTDITPPPGREPAVHENQYEHTTRDVSNSARRTPQREDRASANLSRELKETLETQTSETGNIGHGEFQDSDTAHNTLQAENQVLRTENDCLKRDLAEARIKLDEDARTIRGLEEKIRLLELQRQVSQESPDMPREAGNFFERSHSDVSSIGALTLSQEQFYTPSSSHDINPIRISPDYFSDPATPTPLQTDAASTGYAVLRHFSVDAINLTSPSGA